VLRQLLEGARDPSHQHGRDPYARREDQEDQPLDAGDAPPDLTLDPRHVHPDVDPSREPSQDRHDDVERMAQPLDLELAHARGAVRDLDLEKVPRNLRHEGMGNEDGGLVFDCDEGDSIDLGEHVDGGLQGLDVAARRELDGDVRDAGGDRHGLALVLSDQALEGLARVEDGDGRGDDPEQDDHREERSTEEPGGPPQGANSDQSWRGTVRPFRTRVK
jgi:hypothetical protein